MRFSTKRYDDQTGLAYFGARFYFPLLGRWLTRDPQPRPDDSGLYRFVDDNPIQRIDPLGMDPSSWSDPFQKNDDYGKAHDPSKKGAQGAGKLSCKQVKMWNGASGSLGGDEGGGNSSSPPPPVKRGKPTLKNYPNQ
jgi:RHS repeat-associated protein